MGSGDLWVLSIPGKYRAAGRTSQILIETIIEGPQDQCKDKFQFSRPIPSHQHKNIPQIIPILWKTTSYYPLNFLLSATASSSQRLL